MVNSLVVQVCSCNACTSLTLATSDTDYTAIQAAADSSVCPSAFDLLLHRHCFVYTSCISPGTSVRAACLLFAYMHTSADTMYILDYHDNDSMIMCHMPAF